MPRDLFTHVKIDSHSGYKVKSLYNDEDEDDD